MGINSLEALKQVLKRFWCTDGIVDLLIHLRGDLLIVHVQSDLVAGGRGRSTAGAVGGAHLAFCFRITVDV